MADLTIKLDPASHARLKELQNFGQRGIDSIVTKAKASAHRKMFTLIQREIRAERDLKVSTVRDLVKPIITSESIGYRVSGKPVPVIDLPHRQTKKGVKFRSRKSEGWALISSGFIATVGSGHKGVFRRVGAKRLPISELYGPGVSVVFVSQARRDAVLGGAAVAFDATISRLITARLRSIR